MPTVLLLHVNIKTDQDIVKYCRTCTEHASLIWTT